MEDIFDPWEPNPEAIAKKEKTKQSTSSSRPVPHSETSPHSPAVKAQKDQEKERSQREQEEKRRASSQVAYAGKLVDPSEFPNSPVPEYPETDTWAFNYLPDAHADYSDISDLNRDINRSRFRLFRANSGLKEAQRQEVSAEIEYRRAHARVMAGLSGGSEKQRTAIADLKTEEEYANYMLAKQVAKEYESLVRQLRVDLDSLAGISHNIRAQMSLM